MSSAIFTIKGVIFRIIRWPLLSLATLLFCIPLSGYVVRIYRGAESAPDVNDWKSLFSEGLALASIELVYVFVCWFINCLLLFILVLVLSSVPGSGIPSPFPLVFGRSGIWLMIFYWWWIPPVVYLPFILPFCILLGIFLPVGSIRYARSRQMRKSFDIQGIIGDIAKIGWSRYLLAAILYFIVIVIPLMIIQLFFFFVMIISQFEESLVVLETTFILLIIGIPLITVFTARYVTLLYDCTGEPGSLPDESHEKK